MGISGPNNRNEPKEIFAVCVCAHQKNGFSYVFSTVPLCIKSNSICDLCVLYTFYRQYNTHRCMLVVSLTIPITKFPPPPFPLSRSLYAIGLECIDIDAAVATVAASADELLLCLESLNWTPHSTLHRYVWPWAVTIYRRLFFRCTYEYTFTKKCAFEFLVLRMKSKI